MSEISGNELVDKLQQAGKIDNLQQVCGIFGCVLFTSLPSLLHVSLKYHS